MPPKDNMSDSNEPDSAAQVVLLLSNAPDAQTAKQIAQALVQEKSAACVNVGAPMLSIYRWQGEVESATEVPMWIKTTRAQQETVQQTITRLHPYDVPEVIVVPITEGLPAYLDWVRRETQA